MLAIKVGMLVSYDYRYLYHSLPLVYKSADRIVLALDKNRKTWSGISFNIEPKFFQWLNKLDIENKITLYEDNFCIQGLSTTESDTRERNMLAREMGLGGWHIQIDSDEYFLDFEGFVNHLRNLEPEAEKHRITVYTRFVTIFKSLEKGFLVVVGKPENIATATNSPDYAYIRNPRNTKKMFSNFQVLHQSWARSEKELELKLKSWGHSNDFNTESYLKLWKALDDSNYLYMSDFHPLTPKSWSRLKYYNQTTVTRLIHTYQEYLPVYNENSNSLIRKIIKNLLPLFLSKKLISK